MNIIHVSKLTKDLEEYTELLLATVETEQAAFAQLHAEGFTWWSKDRLVDGRYTPTHTPPYKIIIRSDLRIIHDMIRRSETVTLTRVVL
jgi:hypothetical protein